MQDVQGLILRFQSYLLKMNEQDASRQALTDVLNRAEESVIESRDAIQNLRTNPIAVVQLADAFGEYSETLSFLSDARVVVESDSNSMEECELDAEEDSSRSEKKRSVMPFSMLKQLRSGFASSAVSSRREYQLKMTV